MSFGDSKTIFVLFLSFLGLSLLPGCGSGTVVGPDGTSGLELIPNPLAFGKTYNKINLSISGLVGGLTEWTAKADADWITLSPEKGSGASQSSISVDRTKLSPGDYHAQVTITSNLGTTVVPVSITVVSGTGRTGTLAFASNRSGHFNLYLLNVNDKSVQRLTSTSADDMSPSWSPDGKKIAFAGNRAGKYGIYVMDLDTGGETSLVCGDRDNLHPSWSPDGKKIAFIRQEIDTTDPTKYEYGLYLVDAVTGTELVKENRIDNLYSKVQYPLNISDTVIYDIEEAHLGNSRPAWTPDSAKIIIESWAYVFTQAASSMIEFDLVNTSAPVRGILENQGIGSSYDSWVDVSPDGTKIALGCSPRVSVVDFNGGIVDPILPADSDIAAAPKWSSDGKQIAYSVIAEDNRDIYIVDTVMSGTDTGLQYIRTRLTEDPADDRTPAWKPCH